MKRFAKIRAFLRGVLDGWRQPHDVGSSRNIEDLTTDPADFESLWILQDSLDRGLNVGQILRAGPRSQAWREGWWPRG